MTLVLTLAVISCREQTHHSADPGRKVVVEVNGHYLYQDEIVNAMSAGLNPEDSASFADKFIRNWISELLLFQNAERNIGDTREIDALVENYRHALIVHSYEQKLIEQKLVKDISEAEIDSFYNGNKEMFVLEEPLLKGVLLKVPLSAPNINRVRNLYQKTDDSSRDELEKYSILNSVLYDAFYESWTPISKVESKLPPMDKSLSALLSQKRNLELRDKEFVYFLKVTDIVGKGDIEPLDRARAEIRRLLRNNNEVRFIEQIKDELYESALEKKKIKIYD